MPMYHFFSFTTLAGLLAGLLIKCNHSHTATTSSAPGQNMNSRKTNAMNNMIELSKLMLSTL